MPSRALRTSAAALRSLLLAATARAESWTLERAIATALERSPDARLARARVEGAQALADQARAASLPRVALQGRYTETNTPMLAFGAILNQRAFHPGIDFNRPGKIDDLNATGSLAYTLYNGGRTAAGRAGAVPTQHGAPRSRA